MVLECLCWSGVAQDQLRAAFYRLELLLSIADEKHLMQMTLFGELFGNTVRKWGSKPALNGTSFGSNGPAFFCCFVGGESLEKTGF